jgi:hypothetical protein
MAPAMTAEMEPFRRLWGPPGVIAPRVLTKEAVFAVLPAPEAKVVGLEALPLVRQIKEFAPQLATDAPIVAV